MSEFESSLFIFRRDLRLEDNTALIEACRRSRRVFTCFIVDPRQVGDANRYRSANAVQFMAQSLEELAAAVERRGGTLTFQRGEAEAVVERLIEARRVEAVFLNRDHTPFSSARDRSMAARCRRAGVAFESYDDCLIHAPDAVSTSAGGPYTVFTPFWKRASALPVRRPRRFGFANLAKLPDEGGVVSRLPEALGLTDNERLAVTGGRGPALAILRGLGRYDHYGQRRDYPGEAATTRLSAYLKFGCISAREAVYACWKHLGRGHPLERQLYWRDFYTHIAHHFPRVFGRCFDERYDRVDWENEQGKFEAWCAGRTGFPIVDAGMRELSATGWMHNRVRMIVASFLTKDLHVDWRRGERAFARQLVDYDPAVNNGNWQWAASTGCDAQPYFRIFNPWLQQKRFDPAAVYVRRWVPELAALEASAIHALHKRRPGGLDYPKPVVDHASAAARARALFEACR